MNPFGVSGMFQANVNQSANSFQDPMSLSRLYPGWGINPAYQTPAHDAPYRPAYNGPNPYASYQKPGFFGGLNKVLNPFAQDPYWGNPVDHQMSAYQGMGQSPFDAGAEIGQRFIAPAVILGMSQAVMGKAAGKAANNFFGSMAVGMGARSGGAVARGVGATAGFFGSFAIPFAVGTAVTHAVDAAVFQPYVRSRQLGNDVHDNFAGVTFSSGGNSISGRGLSGYQSSAIGSAIDSMGIKDMTFSSSQYGGIASLGMRAGLFDDVGSSGDIIKRVSSVASQIKTILAISKDPNIANAIEELSKLRMGGAGLSGGVFSQASSAYGAMGMHASIAGTSVQRLMNGAGMQGQYMFQMNGLTPFMGQLAAGNAFSSFASAQRVGVLSNAGIARMGGVEGATQSALGGQLAGQSTLFNRMQLYNQYIGGGSTGGVIPTVTSFGANAARDPLGTAGGMLLHGNAMASLQSKDPAHLEKQAVKMLQVNGIQPGPGGYSPEHIAMALKGMNLTDEQILAYTNMRAAQTNPNVVNQSLRGIEAQGAEQFRQTLTQHSAGAGIGSTIQAKIAKTYKGVMSGIAENLSYPVTRTAGDATDFAAQVGDWWNYGTTIGDQTNNQSSSGVNLEGTRAYFSKTFGDHRAGRLKSRYSRGIVEELERSANEGGENADIARKLLSSGDMISSSEGRKLFSQFLSSSTNPLLRSALEELDSSTAIYDQVSAALKGNVVARNIPAGVKSASSDKVLMDEAVAVHKLDGPLGVVIQDALNSGKYSALSTSLNGLSPDQKIARVRGLVEESARSRSPKNLQSGLSREALNQIIANLDTSDVARKQVLDASSSPVAWRNMEKTSMNLDDAARELKEAAQILKGMGKKDEPVSGWDQMKGFFNRSANK